MEEEKIDTNLEISTKRLNTMMNLVNEFNKGLSEVLSETDDYPFYAITFWPGNASRELKLQSNFNPAYARHTQKFMENLKKNGQVYEIKSEVTDGGYVNIQGWFDLTKYPDHPKYMSVILC